MNHQQLIKQMNLAHNPDQSQGEILFEPRGLMIFDNLKDWIKQVYQDHDYYQVLSPLMWSDSLWEKSGHLEKFKDKMFFCGEGKSLKPMNCPGHANYFSSRPRSYKELPMRIAEIGKVHRKEQSGSLNGLLRMNSFSIDDAHIFVQSGQEKEEILACLHLAKRVYDLLSLSVEAELSLRPANHIGSSDLWDKAEKELEDALKEAGFEYQIKEGEGAFYGPKIDLHSEDAFGKPWQMGSVQLDYQMPIRFDLSYIHQDGSRHNDLVLVHRALLGSLERFMAILLEQSQGRLPVFLDSEVVILPLHDDCSQQLEYAEKIKEEIKDAKVIAKGSLSSRIKKLEAEKRPVIMIIGDKEVSEDKISMRINSENGSENLSFSREEGLEKIREWRKKPAI